MIVCRACGGDVSQHPLDLGRHPIAHHLVDRPNEVVDTFPFVLGQCSVCALVQVLEPISSDLLYSSYHTPSSWKNQPHARAQVAFIHDVLHLSESDLIVEIGCNDGSFLSLLRGFGFNNLIGVEPTKDMAPIAVGAGHTVINSFFHLDLALSLRGNESPGLVVIRQVLEHVSDLNVFLEGLNALCGSDTWVLIEVPDSEVNFRSLDYALWEEHVNYFTASTLRRLLLNFGFTDFFEARFVFSGATLAMIFRKKRDTGELTHSSVKGDLELFKSYSFKRHKFLDHLHIFFDEMRDVCLYGAGARSINFIAFNGLAGFISSVCDDQAEKQGLFLPGTQLKIQRSEDVSAGVVILGVATENEVRVMPKIPYSKIYSVLPPSTLLPEFWVRLIER